MDTTGTSGTISIWTKFCRNFRQLLLLEVKFCEAEPLRDIFLRKRQEVYISISQALDEQYKTWRVTRDFSVWAAKNEPEKNYQKNTLS